MERFKGITLSFIFLFAVFMLLSGTASTKDLPGELSSEEISMGSGLRTNIISYTGDGPGYTLYFRPGIRFGSNRVIGYFDILAPIYFTDKSVLFFNPKVSFDDREGYEWNLGLGYRHMLLDDKLIIGGNIFWDWRKSSTEEQYHQLGLGLELMTEFGFTGINARVNRYISLSEEEIVEQWREYYFTSTTLAYSVAYRIEEPLSGIDYEAGFRVPYLSDYIETWVYAGGYNFFSDWSDDINGFMARLEIIPTDFFKANYEYRNDNVRGDEHYGEFTVTLPFSIENLITGKNPFEGLGSRIGGSRDMTERLYEQVRRDVDIVIETTDITRETHLDDVLPGDTNYIGMVYVDSSNTTGIEDGTLEHPWDTIGEGLIDPRVPNSWVFVFEGVGYPPAVTMNTAGTTLWGEGYDLFGMGLSGYPILANTLTIDNQGITVMGLGFNLLNVNDYAIEILPGAGDAGFTIRNNSIDITNAGTAYGIYLGCFGGGIDVGTPTDPILIANNTINAESTTDEAYGVHFWNGGNLYGSFTNNLITVRADDEAYGFFTHVGGGYDLSANFTGNSINIPEANYGAGFYVERGRSTNTTYTTNFAYNSIDIDADSSADGIYLFAGGGSNAVFTSTFIDNTITLVADNNAYGIYAGRGGGNNRTFTNYLSGNRINIDSDGSAYGFYSWAGGGSNDTFTNTFIDNTITLVADNNAYGIYASRGGGTNRTLIHYLSGNTINIDSGGRAYGFYSWAGGGGDDTVTGTFIKNIMNVDANNNDAYGFYFRIGGDHVSGSIFASYFSENTIGVGSGTGNAYGIYLWAGRDMDVLSTISGNSMTVSADNDAYGAYLYSDCVSIVGIASINASFISNFGSVYGIGNSYLLWLEPEDTTLSSVFMGAGFPGMGSNSFTAPTGWNGNYGINGEVQDNSGVLPIGSYIIP